MTASTFSQSDAGRRRQGRTRGLIREAACYLVLTAACVVAAGPIVYLVATSLKQTYSRVVHFDVFLHPTFANYTNMWTQHPVGRWLVNSLIVACAITILSLLLDSAAGFAFAKLRFKGRDTLFVVLLSAVMIPFPVTLLTTYLLVGDVNRLNTYEALIVPALALTVGVFLMRQFIQTIPSELLDAGRIDGLSDWGLYFRIVLPLSVPGLAVLALFVFMTQWGSLLWPLVAATTDAHRTIQPGLATIPGQFATDWGLLSAATLISMIPMLLVFIALQRYLVKGIAGGRAAKG